MLIDNIDRQIISLLRLDARTSVSAIAKQLKLSRATVQNRINKLEKNKIIIGYSVMIGTEGDHQLATVKAMMAIELEGNSSQKVRASLLEEPSIVAIHSTNGRWDLVLELEADSLLSFDTILGRIRSIKGVSNSETSILLSTLRLNLKS